MLQQCPRDAQTLLLTSGKIRSALAQIRVQPLRKLADEVPGLRMLAGFTNFLIARVGIAPAHIVADRPGDRKSTMTTAS